MLKVVGERNADLREVAQGDQLEVEWVRVEDPNADPETFVAPDGFPPIQGGGRSGPFLQGEAGGGAVFRRGEGCWYHRDVVYFVDTSGGVAGKGSVFALELPSDPVDGVGRLTAIFVSPDEETADNPDNITLSPRGGILLCEDGGGQVVDGERSFGTRLVGINARGESFAFAENNVQIESPIEGKPFIAPADYRGSEFAGATFSPFGRTLFVNIQTPGITFAIEGPWWRGGL
jgi:secreted PhoX family phosphatase